MPAKLLIVQNELKDRRGHYLETALAVADAAPRCGLTPYILAHATCPPDLAPAGVPLLPICRLDHQMHYPLVPALTLGPFTIPPLLVDPATPKPSSLRRVTRRLFPRPSAPSPPDDLDRAGCGHERHFIDEWRKDLAFALTLLRVTAADHVVFLTAHARELHAVRRVADALPAGVCPRFHLEFRHALDFTEPDRRPLNPFTATHLALFDRYRPLGPHPRIRLYTDTAELSEVYAAVSQLAHFTLPIPFRNGKLPPHRRGDGPLRITVVGDPRDEKGFHHLPAVIDALAGEPVRFVLQAGVSDVANNPRSVAALADLRTRPRLDVELVGLTGPLTADDYFALVASADVLVFPFDPAAYRRRSSGTLTEAIAAGVPTVVPDNTWLASQQPAGGGERFARPEELADAVRRVVRGYDGYERRAAAARADWLAVHTPERFVQALLY